MRNLNSRTRCNMRIEASDISKSIDVLREYGADRVWLFGSALQTPEDAGDLDLACEGVPADRFYRALGQLGVALGKPVDLVDLSRDSRLTRYIRSKGRLLYDAGRSI